MRYVVTCVTDSGLSSVPRFASGWTSRMTNELWEAGNRARASQMRILNRGAPRVLTAATIAPRPSLIRRNSTAVEARVRSEPATSLRAHSTSEVPGARATKHPPTAWFGDRCWILRLRKLPSESRKLPAQREMSRSRCGPQDRRISSPARSLWRGGRGS
jgi:hypothetical protein